MYYGAKLIEGADAGSFALIDDSYARDRMRVFYSGKVVARADPNTFRKLDHTFAVDDQAVFFQGESVARAERKSFRLIPDQHPIRIGKHGYADAEDRNAWYSVKAGGLERYSKRVQGSKK